MATTIMDALYNASYNLKNIRALGAGLIPLAEMQLNNAIILLEKKYSLDFEMDEFLEKYENLADAPRAEVIEYSTYSKTDRDMVLNAGGSQVIIGKAYIGFYEKLCSLPESARIELMNISVQDMQEFIASDTENLKVRCIELLKKKWRHKETGDRADLTDPYLCLLLFGLEMGKTKIINKINQDRVSREDLMKIKAQLESQDDLYTEDE